MIHTLFLFFVTFLYMTSFLHTFSNASQMQMQLELQGYDMSQMDPEMQQQLLMSMDPMMMYGMEPGDEDMEGDQWLPPDSAFLQQQMQQGGGQPWGGGVVFAGDDEYEEYYEEEEETPKVVEVGKSFAGSKKGSPTKSIIPSADIVDNTFTLNTSAEISDASIEIGEELDDDDDDDAGF